MKMTRKIRKNNGTYEFIKTYTFFNIEEWESMTRFNHAKDIKDDLMTQLNDKGYFIINDTYQLKNEINHLYIVLSYISLSSPKEYIDDIRFIDKTITNLLKQKYNEYLNECHQLNFKNKILCNMYTTLLYTLNQ